jgi:hypothetical protein
LAPSKTQDLRPHVFKRKGEIKKGRKGQQKKDKEKFLGSDRSDRKNQDE